VRQRRRAGCSKPKQRAWEMDENQNGDIKTVLSERY